MGIHYVGTPYKQKNRGGNTMGFCNIQHLNEISYQKVQIINLNRVLMIICRGMNDTNGQMDNYLPQYSDSGISSHSKELVFLTQQVQFWLLREHELHLPHWLLDIKIPKYPCRIFCEGVQGNGNGVIKEYPPGMVSLASASLSLVHIGLVGCIDSIGLVGPSQEQQIDLAN